ncbi:ALP1-like protein, partial [Tanacetum coccineum]
MARHLFNEIVTAVIDHDPLFRNNIDCTRKEDIFGLLKCTSSIRQLAYGVHAEFLDEYMQINERSSRLALDHFCESVMQIYGPEYLRKPTVTDVEKLYLHHEENHGFPGMLRSLDCTDWEWFGCPYAFKAQYVRRDHAPEIPFVANGVTYPSGYYLVDGIYPELAPLVKTIPEPADDDHKRILYKQKQESARKDVERAFGVLKKKWAILANPTRALKKERIIKGQNTGYWQQPNPDDSSVEQVATSPTKKKKETRNRQKKVTQTEPAPRQTAWTTEEEITMAKGWQACNVKRMAQESGAGDEDYIQKAMIHYQAQCGLPFKFCHCWDVLKDRAKFQEIASPNFNQGSQGSSKRQNSSGSSSKFDDHRGRDKAKNKGSKASGSSTMNDDALARLMVTEVTVVEVAQREKFMKLKRREVECREQEIAAAEYRAQQEDMRRRRNLFKMKVGIPEFLNGIGNGVEMYAEKLETEFEDLHNLLVAGFMKLKKINIGDDTKVCKHAEYSLPETVTIAKDDSKSRSFIMMCEGESDLILIFCVVTEATTLLEMLLLAEVVEDMTATNGYTIDDAIDGLNKLL